MAVGVKVTEHNTCCLRYQYAPQQACNEAKECFCQDLQALADQAAPEELLLVLCDMNAHTHTERGKN